MAERSSADQRRAVLTHRHGDPKVAGYACESMFDEHQ
jgi:hypothetical protein